MAEGSGTIQDPEKEKKIQAVMMEFERQAQLERRNWGKSRFGSTVKIFAVLFVLLFFFICLLLLKFIIALNRVSGGVTGAEQSLGGVNQGLIYSGILLVLGAAVFCLLLVYRKFKK